MGDQDELRVLLARVRRRWLARTAFSAAGRAAAAAGLPLAGAALAGWLVAPSGALLLLLAVAALSGAAGAAALVVSRRWRRPDDGRVARFIEERTAAGRAAPIPGDALVSAAQVAESPDRHPGGLAQLLVGRAVRALREIDPSDVISSASMRRAVFESAAGLAVLAVALAAAFPHLQRAGATAWVSMFPQSIQIAVLTGDARLPAGQPLRIRARVHGRGARLLSMTPSLVVSADGQHRTVPMELAGDGFEYAFESVDRTFRYHVAARPAASQSYTVTALFPPRVRRIDLRYEYPSFARLEPRVEEDGGDIHGPAGTRVRLTVQTDKAVAAGALTLSGGRLVALAPAGGTAMTAEMVLASDDRYRVKLKDADGLQSSGEIEYFIRVMDDRPPDVRIIRPAADQDITQLEEVVIEARADDDYGIAGFDLVYTVAGREARTVPFARVTGSAVAKAGSYILAAEELRVQPGDVITYYAQARDVARGKRSTGMRSDMFFLEVKPFHEEFVAAGIQAMGGGAGGTQIDGLIAAQKEIISATWNLERRSASGRSAQDLQAVGAAQAELKVRAEQMIGGARRGGRGLFPRQRVAPLSQPSRRTTGVDPIATAIEAMDRAIEQLGKQRTADALPHEMAALQGLLQAQAEVRRRQVMQQSAGGAGGGTSRVDRDLSALFDRELQRQQRTTYETPPQPQEEAPQPMASADVLDRVRDLARRQEELARRQHELAEAELSAEERTRQLERLTREQQELREQVEALERHMESSRSSQRSQGRRGSGSSGRAGRGAAGSGGMGDAAEAMRRAAGEMRRENARGAAASGEKAADALRRLERQMRGATGESRQRAAGELQLEAQQMAGEQRRISAEVARLEEAGRSPAGRHADARRRLAAEKDRLADRVDELERAARQLERDAPGAAGTPFRDAATQLQEQQIGARMRSSADQLRGVPPSGARADAAAGQQLPGQAQVEQQLSRALDSVVDALGGSAPRDARRLTDELDLLREMRERLDRLQQQVREVEASADRARQPGREGSAGQGDAARQQVQRAQEAYGRELDRSRDTLGRLQRGAREGGGAGATPEQHELSRSAPGNEAFKQDFSQWELLRKDVDHALEHHESALAARLARSVAEDRLSGGGSEGVPEAYRSLVSRYFESLAKVKK